MRGQHNAFVAKCRARSALQASMADRSSATQNACMGSIQTHESISGDGFTTVTGGAGRVRNHPPMLRFSPCPPRCSVRMACARGCCAAPLSRMSGLYALLLTVLACVSSTHAEPLADVHAVAVTLDARLNVELQPAAPLPPVDAEAGVVGGGADSSTPASAPAPGVPVLQTKPCRGVPVTSSYTAGWTCSATDCTAQCVSGAKTPYGPATAVCDAAGNWVVQGPGCLAGGVYNFDDVTTDGSLPNRFLGLSWQGLRVTNSQRFSACDGNSGFRYGVVSGPNVAYSMEVGASGDMTNLVRITAPTPSSRISVLGFTATAAWQDGLRIDVTAWDGQDRMVGMSVFNLSFFRPSVIDLRADPRFSGIYRLQIITSGGQKVSCATGKQVVLDNLEVYLHGE